MKRILSWYCVLLVLSPSYLRAQYYEEKEYKASEARYIGVGAVGLTFEPRHTNDQADSLKIRFKRIMPVVSFKHGTTEIQFGYTTYSLDGSSKSAIYFGGRFATEVPLAGRRPGALLFPLMLAADFTKAESPGPSRDDFNIASVGIGGGLKYRYANSSVDVSIGVVEVAQYSAEGFSVGSGFSASTLGDAVVLLKDINMLEGVVVGYRFRMQTWAMSENKFNYRSVSHGPYVGIMF